MGVKRTFFLVIATIYICYILFPLVADIPFMTPRLVCLLTFTTSVLLFPRAFVSRTTLWCFIYLFLLYCYLLIGKPLTVGIGRMSNSSKFLIELAFILPAMSLFNVVSYLDDNRVYRFISRLSISVILLSCLYIIPLLMENRTVLRMDDSGENNSFGLVGLPSLTLMHTYVMLLPALLYNVRETKNPKKLWAICLVLVFCFLIYSTFITTSLFLAVICLIISLIFLSKKRVVAFVVSIILISIVLLLYYSGAVLTILDKLIEVYEGTFVEYKLEDIRQSILMGSLQGGSLVNRIQFHDISTHSFLSNPLFGTGVVGDHSSILDRLGGMGLFVFIPFAGIFVSFFKVYYRRLLDEGARFFYVMACCVILAMLYNKGVFGDAGWLISMVILPSVVLSIQQKKVS